MQLKCNRCDLMVWTCEGYAGDHMRKDMVGLNRRVRRHHQLIL